MALNIVEVLSCGAYSSVYLCEKTKVKASSVEKSLVVLKVVRTEDPSSVERKVLQTVKHPFVVKLIESTTIRKGYKLVLEQCSRGDLYQLLSEVGRLPTCAVKLYAVEIFLGLEALHKLHIAHRDLKLENIGVSDLGHLKLIDFGSAHIFENDFDSSVSKRGTLEYMSPEVLNLAATRFEPDFWALGIVAFEMLCGFHPFDAENVNDLILGICTRPPEFSDALYQEDTAQLIRSLLAKDKEKRMNADSFRQHVSVSKLLTLAPYELQRINVLFDTSEDAVSKENVSTTANSSDKACLEKEKHVLQIEISTQ